MQNKTKNPFQNEQQRQKQKQIQIRNWAILLSVIAVVAVVMVIASLAGSSGHMIEALALPCYAHQDVTAFQDGVLYYDGASIHFVNAGGGIEWSYPVGDGASFSTSDTHIIVWADRQLAIVDAQGRSSYNRAMDAPIQFARIGKKHAAIVTGDDLNATLYVKDLQGSHIDAVDKHLAGQVVLDCGFYGNSDEYLWTMGYDYYASVVTSVLQTFQVGQMNTGSAVITSHLPGKVIYVNDLLSVFTTQQMYTYDYRGVETDAGQAVVYGWRYHDHHVPKRGAANILLVPDGQTGQTDGIHELRIIAPNFDRRYTLPTACVGAAVEEDRLYAFSSQYMFSGKIDSQRFYTHQIPLPDDREVTGFIGLTSNGYAIVVSNSEVFSVTLPK